MKKIFFSFVALAALAACTKTEVAYDDTPQEIGFTAVAGNMTKSPVSGTAYPTTLNMYVNAFVNKDEITADTPDYFANVKFVNRKNNENNPTDKWGGDPAQYWPNTTALKFSGYSISGNIGESNKGTYNPKTDVLSITGYEPGTSSAEGANDLMWFPATTPYNKSTGNNGVTAEMYHTCAWITFLVQGDAVTSLEGNKYTITSLKINGVNMKGNVTCSGTAVDESISLSNAKLKEFVKWTNLSNNGNPYVVTVYNGVSLVGTYTPATPAGGETPGIPESYSPKNIETGVADDAETSPKNEATVGGNIVVIPQDPGTIDLAWSYKSPTGDTISDAATGLSLALGSGLAWEPGKHYVYTITIKANEILIAPTPVEWVAGDMTGNGGVTVE